MSEQLPKNLEAQISPELVQLESLENLPQSEIKPARSEQPLDIDEARTKILEQPPTVLELPVDDSPDGNQPQYIDRAIKAIGLKKELKSIRQKLPASQKLLSLAIHQPIIRKTSELGARTISRPSGLLGGGILAFFGSLIYLLFDKYIGLTYNYFIFILLFVTGFILSIFIELLVSTFKHK